MKYGFGDKVTWSHRIHKDKRHSIVLNSEIWDEEPEPRYSIYMMGIGMPGHTVLESELLEGWQ